MKKATVVFLASALLMMLAAVIPAFAIPADNSNTSRIEFNTVFYLVSYIPPERTWYSADGQIVHTAYSTSIWISSDKLVTGLSHIDRMFNSKAGKGEVHEKFVHTYAAGSIIGEAVIDGIMKGETANPNNLVGTGYEVGHGSSNLFTHITEKAACSWHPVNLGTPQNPIMTIEVTVTGVYIVEE